MWLSTPHRAGGGARTEGRKEGRKEAEGWFGNSRSWGGSQARQHRADKRSPPCAESGEGGFRAIFGSGLLSHMTLCSIIGEEELNYRVRNGIGCTLSSMNTKTNLYVILIDRGLGRGKFLKNKPLGLLVLVS